MSDISASQIKKSLKNIPLVAAEQTCADALTNCSVVGSQVRVELTLGYPLHATHQAELKQKIQTVLGSGLQLTLDVLLDIKSHAPQGSLKNLPGIKNIIAIGSGKGGVGKSTTAVNLAFALVEAGAKVGLLDADIYGPNQPKMLGLEQRPQLTEEKKLLPIERDGLKTMSMGYLVAKETPMVWRGPMISSALNQLLMDTLWGKLDYLIVDLPPGTGDIQLTLAKKIPVSGAVIVTTPQDVALLDAEKAYHMFAKLNVPVLGIVENMSAHVCSQCGHVDPIFGEQGGVEMAARFELELLGQLPLELKIRQAADAGTPLVVAEAESEVALIYKNIAMKMAAILSRRPKSYSHIFSNIVVEKE